MFRTIEVDDIVNWGKEQLFPGALLCVPFSGGIDSAVCLALAERAIGHNRVIVLHMGHTSLKPEETENANRIADFLGVRLIRVDLTQPGLLYRSVITGVMEKITGSRKRETETTETIQNLCLSTPLPEISLVKVEQ